MQRPQSVGSTRIFPSHDVEYSTAINPPSVNEKILSVIHCLDGLQTGGTELNAARTAIALHRRGVRVQIAVLRDEGPLGKMLRDAGIPIHVFPLRGIKHWTALRCMSAFASFCRQQKPDVVHCHDVYTNTLLGTAARLAGVPRVIVSRRWGVTQYPRLLTQSSRLSYRFAHIVLANSQRVGASVHTDEGVQKDRILVLPNFVDNDVLETDHTALRHQLRRTLRIDADAPVITMVARLVDEKDHVTALNAFQKIRDELPSTRMILIGGGPGRESLLALASELGLGDSVLLLGEQSPGWKYYSAGDIAMLTSRREGFPNSLVEAMALGLPIVATNVGGVPDAVHHESTGFLAPAGDVAALAKASLKLLQDHELRRAFSDAAARRARLEYSETVVIDRLLQAYSTPLEKLNKTVTSP